MNLDEDTERRLFTVFFIFCCLLSVAITGGLFYIVVLLINHFL